MLSFLNRCDRRPYRQRVHGKHAFHLRRTAAGATVNYVFEYMALSAVFGYSHRKTYLAAIRSGRSMEQQIKLELQSPFLMANPLWSSGRIVGNERFPFEETHRRCHFVCWQTAP